MWLEDIAQKLHQTIYSGSPGITLGQSSCRCHLLADLLSNEEKTHVLGMQNLVMHGLCLYTTETNSDVVSTPNMALSSKTVVNIERECG